MFRSRNVSDRASTGANLALLRERASDAAVAIAPRVQQARVTAEPYVNTALERVTPYVIIAQERAQPFLITLRDVVEPYAAGARDRVGPVASKAAVAAAGQGRRIATEKIKPGLDAASTATKETVAPAVLAAIDTAVVRSEPVRVEAAIRGLGAIAALRGQRPRRRGPFGIIGALLLGALLGAAAAEVGRRVAARGLTVAPIPLRPSTVTIPESLHPAVDEDESVPAEDSSND